MTPFLLASRATPQYHHKAELLENITAMIYQIRGQKVMLDRHLAELYQVETRTLKQAVRRNIARFSSDFMFELSLDEDRALRSQNVILKRAQHAKYPPMAFTEQGVAMLSSVLKSEQVIQVNIYPCTQRILRISCL